MTQTATNARVEYTGNNSTTAFAMTFPITASSDVSVYVDGVLKTITTHYTVAVTSYPGTGTITFTSGNTPGTGAKVLLIQNVPLTQPIDYVAFGAFTAATNERGLDRNTMHSIRREDKLDTKFGVSDTMKVSDRPTMTIADVAADRASKIIGFNAAGTALVAVTEIGEFTGNWAASTAYVLRDLIKDTSNNNIYICIVAHTSSGSQPISSNADSAKWSLIVDAAAAATSATAAATSATAAATSATASATSATSSASSASTATTQASNASTSASAAATSATNAATSYDNFDDRFLGAKSSDPSVNNDGDALITGAIYFNSSNNVMMVYTGSAWVRTTPTSSSQTNIDALSASAVIADMAILGTSDIVADMAILGTSDVVADMAILATTDVVADMNTLGTSDVVSDMNTLGTADVVSDMNTLATSDVVADMNTLATSDIVSDMNTLATSANVTAMGLLGTSANVTAMSNCSGSIANINTTASNISGVNSFAQRYRVLSSEPSSDNDAGDLYFNTTTNELRSFGTTWQATAPSSANQANINIVAGELVYEEDLGSIASALTTSSGNNITDVADDIANVNTVAGAIANVNLTAGSIANVNLTGGSITNVNLVGGSIADVNRYANEYTIASSAPGSPSEGDLWYDSTNNVLKVHTGSAFVAVTSATAGIMNVADDSSPELGGNLDVLARSIVSSSNRDIILAPHGTGKVLVGALDCQNNNVSNCGTIDGTNLQIDFGSIA